MHFIRYLQTHGENSFQKEEFERYVYWHGNFGMHFKTNDTCIYRRKKFAVMCDMDAVSIVEKRDKYAKTFHTGNLVQKRWKK